jgi:hypothetical protein
MATRARRLELIPDTGVATAPLGGCNSCLDPPHFA